MSNTGFMYKAGSLINKAGNFCLNGIDLFSVYQSTGNVP